ncbi:MAG: PIN domain-containing protein [Deltaproteobacteria bacterium]|nr:PIN domain-containing protein [Deltaproteobacteria bacterium]
MKKVVIDTNALISFVTDRNPNQQSRIAAVFEDAARLRAAILCPQNVLTEFVYVLEKIYHRPKPQIRAMIADLVALPGVQIIHALDVDTLLRLWPDPIPDFGDAIVAVLCKLEKGASVGTFDKKFIRSLHAVGVNTVRW